MPSDNVNYPGLKLNTHSSIVLQVEIWLGEFGREYLEHVVRPITVLHLQPTCVIHEVTMCKDSTLTYIRTYLVISPVGSLPGGSLTVSQRHYLLSRQL